VRIYFEAFVLDTGARLLLKGGIRVHLEPKALELLELLVERRPEAVAKTQIQRQLWPETFVSESSLTGLVAQVRKALDDDRRQERFLRTVHGFGYAFNWKVRIGSDRDPSRSARLVWEGSVFQLQPGDNVLGRAEETSVRIDAPGVSRRHARIVVAEDGVTIEDLASKNGTFAGDRRIDGLTPLRDGDRLWLGRQLVVFRAGDSTALTWTECPTGRLEP
jgi:DNA-binding winged helix-turn-helix (wHTH) protein